MLQQQSSRLLVLGVLPAIACSLVIFQKAAAISKSGYYLGCKGTTKNWCAQIYFAISTKCSKLVGFAIILTLAKIVVRSRLGLDKVSTKTGQNASIIL